MPSTQPSSQQLSDLTALLDAQRRSGLVRELTRMQALVDDGVFTSAQASAVVDIRGSQFVVNPDPADVRAVVSDWVAGLDLAVDELADDDAARDSDWPQVRLAGQPRQLALALARAGVEDDEDAWLS